jgi:hypothetical protein
MNSRWWILVGSACLALTQTQAEAQVDPAAAAAIAARVDLGCALSASDVMHTYRIKNTTAHPIPKDTILKFMAGTNHGSIKLTAALAPGAETVGQAPGQTNGGACSAYFYANADLTVTVVGWTLVNGVQTAQATVQNLSDFASARPSVTKIEQVQCPGTVLTAKDVSTPSVPKRGSVVISVPMQKGNNQYLQATANSTGAVIESNRNNNYRASSESQSSSCIPH